ncbi:MAG: BtrH N-terminal domain-containing protein, partial [Chloroflexi bacterium]|nr:BtrH N-terminal domain-containing protein [Chloroflexota bacterium]
MTAPLMIQPIAGFKALDGCHCVTSSFKKMCAFNGYDISEEMLFGLGAGLGFMYWQRRGALPFFGGRGHNDFNQALAQRTGIQIVEHETSSRQKAERELLRMLDVGQPVCLYADMAFLTYMDLPEDAHFGGHLIVVA